MGEDAEFLQEKIVEVEVFSNGIRDDSHGAIYATENNCVNDTNHTHLKD